MAIDDMCVYPPSPPAAPLGRLASRILDQPESAIVGTIPQPPSAQRTAACRILAPMSTSKVASMRDAVAGLVRDGDTVAIEGFTHLISFAAGHEIIRQRKRDLTLARLTPDLIYDQMIAGGVARKLIFSWLGNPGVGGLGAIRRRIETGEPAPLEVEEYSHFGMVGRYTAGAANLPFFPIRSYFETDMPVANPLIREIESPYGDGTVFAVPPLKPDVTIVHAQRADAAGNTQVWGLLGCQKEAAFAAERVIVVVEELVDEAVIRADPNRTIIPGLIVDAVVVEPFGAHPSYVQGAYDRDNRFYLDWDAITRDEASIQAWLREWVYDLDGRAAYIEKLGAERVGLRSSRAGAVRRRRLRGVPMTGPGPACRRPPAFSKSEMMIVAAARELAGQRVCFVGVGLPNIAVNLAQRTVAPDLELVYEAGRLRGTTRRACRSRSATRRSSPAPPRSSRCTSCSASTCRAGWWTSGSWVRPRSTGSGTSTRP